MQIGSIASLPALNRPKVALAHRSQPLILSLVLAKIRGASMQLIEQFSML
jgi:hypothetical protein